MLIGLLSYLLKSPMIYDQIFIHLKNRLPRQFYNSIQLMYLLFKPTFKATITLSAKLILN
jgi:hypothetical protein